VGNHRVLAIGARCDCGERKESGKRGDSGSQSLLQMSHVPGGKGAAPSSCNLWRLTSLVPDPAPFGVRKSA